MKTNLLVGVVAVGLSLGLVVASRILMVDFATYPLTPIHEKISRFCRDHDIDVLDLLPRFRNQRAAELSVFLDGHPNAAADRIFADAIATYLEPRLR